MLEVMIREPHRREITVVACELRWFSAFADRAEPAEPMALLGQYLAALGALAQEHGGTVGPLSSDHIMIVFGDPLPHPDHAQRAVRMAKALCERVANLSRTWRRHGYEPGVGVGIAMGYATIASIGFGGRVDDAVIGTVTHYAARLAGEAANGKILMSPRVRRVLDDAANDGTVG